MNAGFVIFWLFFFSQHLLIQVLQSVSSSRAHRQGKSRPFECRRHYDETKDSRGKVEEKVKETASEKGWK